MGCVAGGRRCCRGKVTEEVIVEDGVFYTVAGERLYAEVDVEELKADHVEHEKMTDLRIGALETSLQRERRARAEAEAIREEALREQAAQREYVDDFSARLERMRRARAESKGEPDG